MKKILFITPHVSTGGLPQYLLTKIKLLRDHFDITVLVWDSYEGEFNIQAKQIEKVCKVHRIPKACIGEIKTSYVRSFITSEAKPDIIHFEELPELFMSEYGELLNEIFGKVWGKSIVVLCSTHTSQPFNIEYIPDHFIFPSEHCNKTMYPQFDSLSSIWEEPIANNKHIIWDEQTYPYNIIQVGLWSPHKNQGYSIDVVRAAIEYSRMDIQLHFVGNMAGNFKSYWEPLKKIALEEKWITIHGEKGKEEIEFMYKNHDLLLMPSTMELNPLVPKEALGWGMPVMISDLKTLPSWYRNNSGIGFLTGNIEQDAKAIITLLKLGDHDFERPVIKCKDLIHIYEDVEPLPQLAREVIGKMAKSFRVKPAIQNTNTKPIFKVTHFDHLKVEIIGGKGKYTVRCIDTDRGKILHHAFLGPNEYTELAYTYFIPWKVEILQDGEIVHTETLNLENKKVYVSLNSNALGDNLAWIPYIAEWVEKHKCKARVSTFFNQLFEDCYPMIEFVDPEEMQYDFDYFIKIGIFDLDNRYQNPNHPHIIPLQQVASDRLGLPYREIKPLVANINPKPKPEKPFVVICTESTTGAKEWQNPNGWQGVVDELVKNGYEVRVLQKRETKLRNVTDRTGKLSLFNRIGELHNASLFIGLPSGLSWLAWACDVPVVMISGFSEPWCEFKHVRVQNYNVCNGCYNNPDNRFPKDEKWCPLHKDTEREYECTKHITTEMVINSVSKVLSLDYGK